MTDHELRCQRRWARLLPMHVRAFEHLLSAGQKPGSDSTVLVEEMQVCPSLILKLFLAAHL